jgi:hypothetical protein
MSEQKLPRKWAKPTDVTASRRIRKKGISRGQRSDIVTNEVISQLRVSFG